MLQIIPIPLPTLQLIAHFLLIGDILLIIGVFFKLIGNVLRYIIATFLLSIGISFVIYLISQSDSTYL
jgi:hypothetical protein